MSLLGKLFGTDKLANLIRELIKHRFAYMGLGDGFGGDVDALSFPRLMGTPEATLVTIIRTFDKLSPSLGEPKALLRIEQHRSRMTSGVLPKPLNIQSYIKYRLLIEHPGPMKEIENLDVLLKVQIEKVVRSLKLQNTARFL